MELVKQLDIYLRLTWITCTVVILTASIFPLRHQSLHMLTLPQRYSSHVYLVAVTWTTLLLGSTWFYALGKMTPLVFEYPTLASHLTGGSRLEYPSNDIVRRAWSSVLVLLLMEIHVLCRFFQVIYFSEGVRTARIHIAGYLLGILFYIAAPLSMCSSVATDALTHVVREICELIVKSKVEVAVMVIKPTTTSNFKWWELMPSTATSQSFKWWGYLKPLSQVEWFQWIGPIIYLCGFIHQLQTHIFGVSPGWFGYMDHPIVMYFGILLASGASDVTLWLLFVFVIMAASPTFNKLLRLRL